jgi:hypothetical protein
MPAKITWEWLESRLDAVNVTWLERESGLKPKRLNDVKRGKSRLTPDELERVRVALNIFK